MPVTANASDNIGVVGVQFRLDGANLGSADTDPPYSVSWNTTQDSDGPHVLTAVARDAAGHVTTAAERTVSVDNSGPSVSLAAPAEGANVSGSQAVRADASDPAGVAGVQFKLDGNNLGAEDTTGPYSVDWDTTQVSNGSHTLTAVARDPLGNVRTASSVTVVVDNEPPPDTTPPVVSLSSPAAGAVVGGASVGITATASDNIGVTGVQFKVDDVALGGEDTTAPYSVTWNSTASSDGAHTLTAVARDAAGSTASSSRTVTVDNTAPTVSVMAPTDGASVSGVVSVAGSASDGDQVAGVQFRLDGTNLGAEDTTAPYSASWTTTTASNGVHILTAIARDRVGNTRTSAATAVTVANTEPPSGLVAAYGFDEPSGNGVTDTSGTGNAGTISGATRTTTARFGRALNFDGVNDWVTVPDANSLDLTNAMTLEAWVRPTVASQYRTVVLKETAGNLAYALYSASRVGSGSRPAAWVSTEGLNGTAALPNNAWSHLATTYDGSTWRLYVNGAQVATRLLTPPIPTSTQPLRIGGNNVWEEWFRGQIDELRVYNRSLSATEITTDRDRPVNP